MNITTKCGHYCGTGRVKLTGVYLHTFSLLLKHGPINGHNLAKIDGCSGAAMCNRLQVIGKHGLAAFMRNGREKIWRVREFKL